MKYIECTSIKGNLFSRMSSKRVHYHVWESTNMNSDFEWINWIIVIVSCRIDIWKYIDNTRIFLLEEIGLQ